MLQMCTHQIQSNYTCSSVVMASFAPNCLSSRFTVSSSSLILPIKATEFPTFVHLKQHQAKSIRFSIHRASASGGLYSAQTLQLTQQNVDIVLEDVRPYLIADGGNVDVVSVQDGVISLKLQGACGTCPSSTTTMKMGIEKVLKEKFGDAVKDICQVQDDNTTTETTVEAVNAHLEILRPAIRNYGGSVEVLSVEAGAGNCVVKYVGPDSIGSGIKATIKEKFPDILNVVFTP